MVSILTPTYDHEAFVRDCLDSVQRQTFTSWEHIVVDDGSRDHTTDIVAAHTDARRKLIRQQHVGLERLAETYNRALASATGEFVALLEGDDFWAKDALESLVGAIGRSDAVLSYGRTSIVVEGRESGQRIPDDRFVTRFGTAALHNEPVGTAVRAMLHRKGITFTYPCSLLLRRSTLGEIGGFQHITGLDVVDYPTALAFARRGHFAFVDRVVGYWRRHPSSSSLAREARILSRISAFVAETIRSDSTGVDISRSQGTAILESWISLPALLKLQSGRLHLVRGEWGEAEAQFLAAWQSSEPLLKLAATAGLVGSRLHLNIEPLFALAGRQDIGFAAYRPTAPEHHPRG